MSKTIRIYIFPKLAILIAFIFLAIALVGCSTSTPEAVSTTESEPVIIASEIEYEDVEQKPLEFGEAYSYEDGVGVVVDVPFEHSFEHYPDEEGHITLVTKITLMNGSENILMFDDHTQVFAQNIQQTCFAASNEEAFNAAGAPTLELEPGESTEWYVACWVSDPATMSLTYSPEPFIRDDIVWSN